MVQPFAVAKCFCEFMQLLHISMCNNNDEEKMAVKFLPLLKCYSTVEQHTCIPSR